MTRALLGSLLILAGVAVVGNRSLAGNMLVVLEDSGPVLAADNGGEPESQPDSAPPRRSLLRNPAFSDAASDGWASGGGSAGVRGLGGVRDGRIGRRAPMAGGGGGGGRGSRRQPLVRDGIRSDGPSEAEDEVGDGPEPGDADDDGPVEEITEEVLDSDPEDASETSSDLEPTADVPAEQWPVFQSSGFGLVATSELPNILPPPQLQDEQPLLDQLADDPTLGDNGGLPPLSSGDWPGQSMPLSLPLGPASGPAGGDSLPEATSLVVFGLLAASGLAIGPRRLRRED